MVNNLVYLVNAGNDPKYTKSVIHGTSFPPLGVISLGTAVQEWKPDWDVKVFDGQVTEEQDILDGIKADRPGIVGVSVLSTSYQNALNIARATKEAGAVTIFGNDQATITGTNMLAARSEIDYICTADTGEKPFVQFLEFIEGKRPIDTVTKLMYRMQDGTIRHNKGLPELEPRDRYEILDQIPIPDRTLLPEDVREKYLQNYRAAYPDEKVTGATTINRFRGCSNAKKPCVYCGITDLTIRTSSPEVFWKDVRAAKEIGANRLLEAGDSFSSVPRYLKKLISAKPDDIDFSAFVYTSARDITTELASIYKKIGIVRANMGLDSGDNIILRRLKGNRESVEQSARAVKILSKAGINSYASFVLGGPGETKDSIENTVQFTKWLIDKSLVDGTEAQPLFPGINSRSGRMLLNPLMAEKMARKEGWKILDRDKLYSMPEKWSRHENPDPEEISRDWATIFSEVNYDDLLGIAAEIQEYSLRHGIRTGSTWIPCDD